MSISEILDKFPKTRPPLSRAQSEIYEQEYLANRSGANLMSSIAQKLESWMHLKTAKATQGSQILEIGGGNLNHIKYLPAGQVVDVIEPMISLYNSSPEKPRIRKFYSDIKECTEKYDSIYSIAVLEHITDLPQAIACTGLLLKKGGNFVNGIPCEGGMLWGLSWRLSTGLSYKLRTGFSYKNLMRHEHVNNFDEIVALVKHFFGEVKISYFPLPQKHLALYACLNATAPDIEKCQQYLA